MNCTRQRTGRNPRQQAEWFVLFAATIAAIGLARLATDFQLPHPVCQFHRLSGLPCPGCGATRSLVALSHFDLAGALFFNPLLFAGCAIIATAATVSLLQSLTGSRLFPAHWPALRRIGPARLAPTALLLNWLYLCLVLPRQGCW